MSRHAAEAEKWGSRKVADVSAGPADCCCFGWIVPVFRFVIVCRMRQCAKAPEGRKSALGVESLWRLCLDALGTEGESRGEVELLMPEATATRESHLHPKFRGTCIASMDQHKSSR